MPTTDDLKQSMCASLTQMGDNYLHLGQAEKADDYYRQALTIATELGDAAIRRRVLIGLSMTALKLGDYAHAREHYEQAETIKPGGGAEDPLAPAREASALIELGKEAYRQGEIESAASFEQAALRLAGSLSDTGDETGGHFESLARAYLGIIEIGAGQIDQAIDDCRAALGSGERAGDAYILGAAWAGLGLAHTMTGHPSQAIPALSHAVESLNAVNEPAALADAQACLALCLAETGQPDDAGNLAHQALEKGNSVISKRAACMATTALGLARGLAAQADPTLQSSREAYGLAKDILHGGDRIGGSMAALALQALGTIHSEMGKTDEALACYRESETMADGGLDPVLTARAVVGQGHLTLAADPEQAKLFFERARAMAEAAGSRAVEALALAGMGQCDLALGYQGNAMESFEKAFSSVKDSDERQAQALVYLDVGDAYRTTGRPERSSEYYQQALELTQARNMRWLEGRALGGLGLAYAAAGEPGSALEGLEGALVFAREINHRGLMQRYLSALGDAYAALARPGDAFKHYQEALTVARESGDHAGEGALLGSIANLHLEVGQPAKAAGAYRQAIEIDQETGNRLSQARWLSNLGLAYSQLDRLPEAISALETASGLFRELGESKLLAQAEEFLSQLRG